MSKPVRWTGESLVVVNSNFRVYWHVIRLAYAQ